MRDASRMRVCSSASLQARQSSTQSLDSTTCIPGWVSISGIRNLAGHSLSMPSGLPASTTSAICATGLSVSVCQTVLHGGSGTLNSLFKNSTGSPSVGR